MSSKPQPGTKGHAVLETYANAWPDGLSRAEVALSVGCTVQRVGEVIRSCRDLFSTTTGGSAIKPDVWKAYLDDQADNVVPLRKGTAESDAAQRIAAATDPPPPSDSPADVYKRVMAYPDAATDAEFEAATAFAKAKRRKRPVRQNTAGES